MKICTDFWVFTVVDLSLGEVGGLTKEFHQLGLYLNE